MIGIVRRDSRLEMKNSVTKWRCLVQFLLMRGAQIDSSCLGLPWASLIMSLEDVLVPIQKKES